MREPLESEPNFDFGRLDAGSQTPHFAPSPRMYVTCSSHFLTAGVTPRFDRRWEMSKKLAPASVSRIHAGCGRRFLGRG
jgi:hypothetical protein